MPRPQCHEHVAPAAPPQRAEPPAPRFASPQQRFEPPAAQIPPPQRFEPPALARRAARAAFRTACPARRPAHATHGSACCPGRAGAAHVSGRRNGWKRLHRALLRLWSVLSRRHGSKRLRLVPRRRSSQPPRRRRTAAPPPSHPAPRPRHTRNGQTNGEAAQSPVQLARHADCRAPRWRAARTAQCARCLACWLLGHSGNRWPRGPSTGRLAGRSPGPRLRRDAPKPGPSRWHQRCGGAASWARWRCGRAL